MKTNISPNTGSELEKPAFKPVISSNKMTSSELKKPASAVITPNSDKTKADTSSICTFLRILLHFAAFFLTLTIIMLVVFQMIAISSMCEMFEEKMFSDNSSEVHPVSRFCREQEWNLSITGHSMQFIHFILIVVACVCCMLKTGEHTDPIKYVNLMMCLGFLIIIYLLDVELEAWRKIFVQLHFIIFFIGTNYYTVKVLNTAQEPKFKKNSGIDSGKII